MRFTRPFHNLHESFGARVHTERSKLKGYVVRVTLTEEEDLGGGKRMWSCDLTEREALRLASNLRLIVLEERR